MEVVMGFVLAFFAMAAIGVAVAALATGVCWAVFKLLDAVWAKFGWLPDDEVEEP